MARTSTTGNKILNLHILAYIYSCYVEYPYNFLRDITCVYCIKNIFIHSYIHIFLYIYIHKYMCLIP